MFHTLSQFPYFWVAIWSAPADQVVPMYESYVIGTLFVFLPLYALVFVPEFLFGIKAKFLHEIAKYLFITNVALALAPVVLPALMMYACYRLVRSAYRMYRGIPARQHRALPRHED